jgi:hypothetical protein
MLSQGHMITRLGRWLCPALFGPLFAIWIFVTVSVLTGHWDPKLGKWGTWMLGMIFGTLVGGGLGITFLCIDALLLRMRARLLPMGKGAWLQAMAAPFLLFGAWTLWRPGSHDGPLLWLAIVLPMIAVTLMLRLLFSPRFGGRVL